MSDDSERVLHGVGGTSVVVTRLIVPGRERDFEEWCDHARAAAARFPGFVTASLVSPAPDGPTAYTQAFTFQTQEQVQAWVNSPERAQQVARLAGIQQGEAQTQFARGMSAWLHLPGQREIVQPPVWKVYWISALAIYPLVVVFANYTTLPVLFTGGGWFDVETPVFAGATPVWFWLNLATLLNTLAINIPMTWVTMPLVTWVLRRWMEAPHPNRSVAHVVAPLSGASLYWFAAYVAEPGADRSDAVRFALWAVVGAVVGIVVGGWLTARGTLDEAGARRVLRPAVGVALLALLGVPLAAYGVPVVLAATALGLGWFVADRGRVREPLLAAVWGLAGVALVVGLVLLG